MGIISGTQRYPKMQDNEFWKRHMRDYILDQMHTCSFPSYPEVAFRCVTVDTLFFLIQDIWLLLQLLTWEDC